MYIKFVRSERSWSGQLTHQNNRGDSKAIAPNQVAHLEKTRQSSAQKSAVLNRPKGFYSLHFRIPNAIQPMPMTRSTRVAGSGTFMFLSLLIMNESPGKTEKSH
jgi:hypothetical protein